MPTTNLTAADFEATVTGNPIVLVDFCRLVRTVPFIRPYLRGRLDKHGDIVFGKVDTEAERGLAQAAGISSIPTLMAFRDGILLYSEPGALRAADLDRLIEQVEALDMDAIRAELAARQSAGV